MHFACNIDRRGRLARLIYGIVVITVGICVAAFWAHSSGSTLAWVISIGCLMAGAFGVFESLKGWCVMRAIGFKTPL